MSYQTPKNMMVWPLSILSSFASPHVITTALLTEITNWDERNCELEDNRLLVTVVHNLKQKWEMQTVRWIIQPHRYSTRKIGVYQMAVHLRVCVTCVCILVLTISSPIVLKAFTFTAEHSIKMPQNDLGRIVPSVFWTCVSKLTKEGSCFQPVAWLRKTVISGLTIRRRKHLDTTLMNLCPSTDSLKTVL